MSTDPRRRPDGTMRKGYSANPRGRPRRSRNLLTIFNEKRDEKVSLRVDGREVKMSRLEAWVTNLWNRAVELDSKACAHVLAIMRASGQVQPEPGEEQELDAASDAALNSLLERLTRQGDDDGQTS